MVLCSLSRRVMDGLWWNVTEE